jgi:hypothetical protein
MEGRISITRAGDAEAKLIQVSVNSDGVPRRLD